MSDIALATEWGTARLRTYDDHATVTATPTRTPEWAGAVDGRQFWFVVDLRKVDGRWGWGPGVNEGLDCVDVYGKRAPERSQNGAIPFDGDRKRRVLEGLAAAVQAWDDEGRTSPEFDLEAAAQALAAQGGVGVAGARLVV